MKKKRSFIYFGGNWNSNETVTPCIDCHEYLNSNVTVLDKLYKYVWPSFVWGTLIDKEILEVYGKYMWRFIPLKWRYWWIDSLKYHDEFNDISVEYPTPIFKDITEDVDNMMMSLQKILCQN